MYATGTWMDAETVVMTKGPTWSSSNTSLVSINSSGLATLNAGGGGTAIISASLLNFTGTFSAQIASTVLPYMFPDTNTTSHIYFSGSAIRTTKAGESFSVAGTPTFETSGAIQGFMSASTTTYYSSGTTPNNAQFTNASNFTIAILVKVPSDPATGHQFFDCGQGGGNGWLLRTSATRFGFYTGATELTKAVTGFGRKLYLVMFGGDTTNKWLQINNEAYANAGVGSFTAGTQPYIIGSNWDHSFGFNDGVIYEAAIYSTAPTSASLSALYTSVSSSLAGQGIALG
jgi:hypothetical protein